MDELQGQHLILLGVRLRNGPRPASGDSIPDHISGSHDSSPDEVIVSIHQTASNGFPAISSRCENKGTMSDRDKWQKAMRFALAASSQGAVTGKTRTRYRELEFNSAGLS